MGLAALSDGVAQLGEVLYYAFCVGGHKGMIGVGTTDNRWDASVNIVSGG